MGGDGAEATRRWNGCPSASIRHAVFYALPEHKIISCFKISHFAGMTSFQFRSNPTMLTSPALHCDRKYDCADRKETKDNTCGSSKKYLCIIYAPLDKKKTTSFRRFDWTSGWPWGFIYRCVFGTVYIDHIPVHIRISVLVSSMKNYMYAPSCIDMPTRVLGTDPLKHFDL